MIDAPPLEDATLSKGQDPDKELDSNGVVRKKRRRGRPKGSKNKSKQELEKVEVEIGRQNASELYAVIPNSHRNSTLETKFFCKSEDGKSFEV